MYDRRALDTSAPLPLFNSLTHLVYLTSTSPRIREIMTQDGGLERLVRMLHDYCMSPTPPENPASIYGLTPPNARALKPAPTLNPTSFDKHAAYRFSLAFQCVVNIGVRGSEQIRTRVVQAGTLDVVGCVLEAWLASKGFAVGPSASVTGVPRETREQRNARKLAQMEQRQREEAAQLQRALQRQLQMEQRRGPDDSMDVSPSHTSTPGANSDTDMSTDNSIAATPLGSGTPTGASSVVIPARDRSGTLLARPEPARGGRSTSPAPSTDNSRAETETEDDGEPDMMDMDGPSASTTTTSRHRRLSTVQHRHNLGISNNEHEVQGPDAHIIINQGGGSNPEGVGMGDVVEVAGVDDGMEMGMGMVEASVTNNDDFAMGAPPGAPGAIGLMNTAGIPPDREMTVTPDPLVQDPVVPTMRTTVEAPDVTPRAGIVGLPHEAPTPMVGIVGRRDTIRPHDFTPGPARAATANPTPTATIFPAARTNTRDSITTEPATTSASSGQTPGPYRDEDVLFGLQLLAYLSKYPHVRQAFYKPRASFHPAASTGSGSAASSASRWGTASTTATSSGKEKEKEKDAKEKIKEVTSGIGTAQNYLRNLAGNLTGSSRGKEKAASSSSSSQPPATANPAVAGPSTAPQQATTLRQTNVFSLVERFTFKPSSSEIASASSTSTNDGGGSQYQGPQELPEEIQYWAGVIMRNACRKDETRGGIRQCANMLCGRWESYPREFAKCRRCRKAKYCGKECQSTAWSEGHRFWCSTKDSSSSSHSHSHSSQRGPDGERQQRGHDEEDDDERPATTGTTRHRFHRGITINQDAARGGAVPVPVSVPGTGTGTGRRERREREREREQRRAARSTASHNATATAPRAEGMARDRTLQPTAHHPPPRTMPDPLTIPTPTHRATAGHGHGRVSMFHSILGGDNVAVHSPTSPATGSQSGTMRRRAETITPSSAGTMSVRAGDVPLRHQQRRGDEMEERRDREDGMVLG
ncbi:hypothetical protein MD484_g4334, partial [Candolleomyces efflorescens]